MKIVITELIWPIGVELLERKYGNVVYDPELWNDRERLARELTDADAVIVRNQTQVTAELLGSAPRVKVVGRLGVGLDNIDLPWMHERNIVVVYGKNANATSVAEYVISAMFAWSRLLTEAAGDVRSGNWDRKKFTGSELAGKTLGLIGTGEIGHRAAVRARALGLQVLGYDPYVAPFDFPVMESGIRLAGLPELLEQSDFVSLHVPLTPQTRNLIDSGLLRRMKRSAVLVNTSRGGIVNEDDLGAALRDNVIAGAVLDVLAQEPPHRNHPLLQLGNCMITPHVAGLTEESQLRTSEMVAREVVRELEGNVSLCRVMGKR